MTVDVAGYVRGVAAWGLTPTCGLAILLSMEPVSPLPRSGDVFFDPRDEGRFLRVAYHPEMAVFVVSLWRDETCLGTHRLAAADLPRLLHALTTPLALEASSHISADLGAAASGGSSDGP